MLVHSFLAWRPAELTGMGSNPVKLYTETEANMMDNPKCFPAFLGIVLICTQISKVCMKAAGFKQLFLQGEHATAPDLQ